MNKILNDTYLIAKNDLLLRARNPMWLFFGLFQPIVYLVLFSPFLKGIADAPGFPAENAIQFFVPGLLIMNVLFNAGFSGFGLIDKLRIGFLERLRVTPISRLALALGFVLSVSTVLIIQSAILTLAGLLFGLSVDVAGIAVLAVLLLLIGITMASISFAIALSVKDEGTLAAITNFFSLPLLLLSGIMLPVEFAPRLIQVVARFNPFAHAVNAARALVDGSIAEESVFLAFAVFGSLGVLASIWFIRSLRDAVA